jgi:exopolysaccharide production protein ExoQ
LTTSAAGAVSLGASPARLLERAAFVAAVGMLLIYSQGWELMLTGAGPEDAVADSSFIRALFIPAYAAGVALMALSPHRLMAGLVRQPALVALIAVAALSILWSVSPDQTPRRVFALVFTTLSGAVLAARYSWARLAEVVGASFAILALASLCTGLFVPSIGRMSDIFPGSWRGLWLEKNTFGAMMALGAGICAAAALLNPSRARLWWTAAALSFGLVVMSTSKTSLVAALIGAGALALVGLARRGRAGAVAATWLAVAALALAGAVMAFAFDAVLGLLGKDATLTGRTQLWAAVMRQIDERPWLGFGYGAVWDETGRWGPLAWITHDAGFTAHHAHNAWLEQWLTLGVVGLAAWGCAYVQTLAANVVAFWRDRGAYVATPFFVVFSLMTLTESIVMVYNDMRWVLFVAFAVKLGLADAPQAERRIGAK